jgi:hypothetical protein
LPFSIPKTVLDSALSTTFGRPQNIEDLRCSDDSICV